MSTLYIFCDGSRAPFLAAPLLLGARVYTMRYFLRTILMCVMSDDVDNVIIDIVCVFDR